MTSSREATRDWTRLAAAAELATHLHAGQVRKGTSIPYVSHLFAVAALVMEYGGDEDQACAALPHDARAIAADLRVHGGEVFTRFKAGREGTLWYYGALAEAFVRRMPGPLAAELARAVEEMRAAAG